MPDDLLEIFTDQILHLDMKTDKLDAADVDLHGNRRCGEFERSHHSALEFESPTYLPGEMPTM
jgi:hypothetical protein